MASDDYLNRDATRALQSSPDVLHSNYANLVRWGPYNILKVMSRRDDPANPAAPAPARISPVTGYLTLLPAISGLTPLQMRDALGLRLEDLRLGALVYRLLDLPQMSQIEVRGYTTLVDGLELKPGLATDSAGYRPGHGAYQITLKPDVKIKARLIAVLGPNTPFEPGVHPDVAKLYPPGHPARAGL